VSQSDTQNTGQDTRGSGVADISLPPRPHLPLKSTASAPVNAFIRLRHSSGSATRSVPAAGLEEPLLSHCGCRPATLCLD
jgi:hypothetical protein